MVYFTSNRPHNGIGYDLGAYTGTIKFGAWSVAAQHFRTARCFQG